MNDVPAKHIPVLADTLLQQISLPKDAVMVDATIGQGGHAYLLAKKFESVSHIIGFDVDPGSIEVARENLEILDCKVTLIRDNFRNIRSRMNEIGVEKADLVLADLGWCSAQVVDHQRGMSYQENMPLDMRLDDRLEISAADIVNGSNEEEIADIIYQYGEERASRKIARMIVEQRKYSPIRTTGQLSAIIYRAVGGAIASKSRVFQALRIAVNKELDVLHELLNALPELLNPNGYAAIISFHSLEDRIVKENFNKNKKDKIYEVVTKKPLTASKGEIRDNPRSRSAKLRIAKRL
ncbi:MAG: 16S rRNA (cytosine(1402)-N(4))-methyltransferase RsmH [Sedimentisphaeraceae bacterium JB056]